MKINILRRQIAEKERYRITIVGDSVCFVPNPQYPDMWYFFGMSSGEASHPILDVSYRDPAWQIFKNQPPVDFNNPENTENPFIHIPRDGRLGWTKEQLCKLGLPWPPPDGWEIKLIQELSLIADDICELCVNDIQTADF
jgi:hypothetical protein